MIHQGGLGRFRAVGAREAEAAPGSRLGKCEVRELPELLGLLRVPASPGPARRPPTRSG